jgi:hypothetical protein
VHEVDISTGKSKVVQASRPNVWSWYADASGVVRMGVGYEDRNRTSFLLYRRDSSAAFRTVARASTRRQEDLIVPLLFTADPGKAIAYSDHEGYDALYELDLATLATGARIFQADGYDLGSIIANPERNALQGVAYVDTRPRVKWFDPDLALVQSQIDAAVGGRQADIVSMSRDRQRLLVRLGGASQAGRYY